MWSLKSVACHPLLLESPLPALWLPSTCSCIFGSNFLIGTIACLRIVGIMARLEEMVCLGRGVPSAVPGQEPDVRGNAALDQHLARVIIGNRSIACLKVRMC